MQAYYDDGGVQILLEEPPCGDSLGTTSHQLPPGCNSLGPVGDMPLGNAESQAELEDYNHVAAITSLPITEMEAIPGYEQIRSRQESFVIPPPPSYRDSCGCGAVETFLLGPELTEEEARRILVEHSASRCCWSRRAARGMWFKSLQGSTAVVYLLKTFLETRATGWASEPYNCQPIDGLENGLPPAPWDIVVETPEMFRDWLIRLEVPHTATVRSCYNCHGAGRVRCTSCKGWGRKRCYSCQGSGVVRLARTDDQENYRTPCTSCEGTGQWQCQRCRGHGRITCNVCDATGHLKCFVQLTVTFKTYVEDFVFDRTPLPDDLIRETRGTVLFEDSQTLLSPIKSFPEPEVNAQSARIIQEHSDLAQIGRIWRQHHMIRGVPVFQCDCAWRSAEFQFFVYGDESQVYTADYPQTCCWCCRCQLL